MWMMMIRFFAVIALLMLGGCLPKDWSTITVHELNVDRSIESELHYGEIYAFVTIDGSEPLRMLVDTGSPIHSIRERTANRLGLTETGALLLRDYAGNELEQPRVRVHAMQLGSFVFEEFDVSVLPDRAGEDVDGVLGMLGLRGYTLVLDFSTGEMALHEESLNRDDPGVLPFRTTHDKSVLIPFRMLDSAGFEQEYWATLDTGHNSSLLLHPTSTLNCLDRSELIYRSSAIGAHGIRWVTDFYRPYGPVRIGGISYEGITAGANMASNNIGVGMLEGCSVRIDWESKLVQIVRNGGATRLVSCESLGFFSMHGDPDGYRASVIPGSVPEQLGLTHRQIVTRINGEAVDSRFDMTQMWPVPADAVGVKIEYFDPVTGQTGAVVVPID